MDFIDIRERLNGVLETIELLESDLYEAELSKRTQADWTQIIFHVDEAYEALRKAMKYATFEGGKTAQKRRPQEFQETVMSITDSVEALGSAINSFSDLEIKDTSTLKKMRGWYDLLERAYDELHSAQEEMVVYDWPVSTSPLKAAIQLLSEQ